MSRENDARRDDWDEPQSGEYRPDRIRPRQPRPRPSQDGMQQERSRQLPPARRRFTPARDTTGYQRRQQSQQGPASPAPGQRQSNPRRQPRGYRADEDFEQYRRTEPPRRQQPRGYRTNEDYEQYRQPQRSEQPRRYPRPPLDPREDDYYIVDTPPPGTRTRSAPLTTPTIETGQLTQQARPRRRTWPTLLLGCVGGFVTVALILAVLALVVFHNLPNVIPGFNIGTTKYSSKQQSLSLPITGNISQLSIQNQVGNITITTDNAATTGTLTYIKRTLATSQGNATAEFTRMAVAVNHGGGSSATNGIRCPAATCLAVTATVPNTINDAVDMVITLPPQNLSPTFILSSNTQSGTISVQNFNGLLSLSITNTGNISVKGGLLDAGSCLQAEIGNVTFAGTLETSKPPAINPCYGNPISASGVSNDQPWYSMKTGSGNIDTTFTIPPNNSQPTNVQLDVTVPDPGKIINDFNLAVKQNSAGSSNYFGPLLPDTQPAAFLILTVDVSGNITLRKA